MRNQKRKASLFIDAANYHYALIDEGWRIDWALFLRYFEARYDILDAFYYEGEPTEAFFFDLHKEASLQDFKDSRKRKRDYFKALRGMSYRVRAKPITRIYDRTSGDFTHKCNFDVELTVDAIDSCEKFDVFILASGDGDFARLIRYLKGRGKRTVVVSHTKRVSSQLKKAANQVIDLRDIRGDVERQQAQPRPGLFTHGNP